MTEIGFYHLLRTPLEDALPQLLQRTLEAGERALVRTGSEERVKQLDDALWRWGPARRNDGFLPHGTATDGNAEKQPVWLTAADENPNGATFLFLTDGATSDAIGDYARCFNLFDGRNEAAVAEARRRWQAWKEAGHSLTYWQQNDRGWEKKG